MLHSSTFENLLPTDQQRAAMGRARAATRVYVDALEADLPDGPDKAHVLHLVRTAFMWASVAITRRADGAPRQE